MKEFFANLSRATKNTIIICGCFLLIALFVTGFLILCPIPLSRQANASSGRIETTESQTESETETQTETESETESESETTHTSSSETESASITSKTTAADVVQSYTEIYEYYEPAETEQYYEEYEPIETLVPTNMPEETQAPEETQSAPKTQPEPQTQAPPQTQAAADNPAPAENDTVKAEIFEGDNVN